MLNKNNLDQEDKMNENTPCYKNDLLMHLRYWVIRNENRGYANVVQPPENWESYTTKIVQTTKSLKSWKSTLVENEKLMTKKMTKIRL